MNGKTCSIEGCEKPLLARGWCTAHYGRWHKYGDPLFKSEEKRSKYITDVCSVNECTAQRKPGNRGWCSMHYRRWKKYGDVNFIKNMRHDRICSIDGCDHLGASKKHGWCGMHYQRWRTHGDVNFAVFKHPDPQLNQQCTAEDCLKYRKKGSLCVKHWREIRNELRVAQQSKCAICGKHESEVFTAVLFLDHDHISSKPRGLLCKACNSALGHFYDRVSIITSAVEYLSQSNISSTTHLHYDNITPVSIKVPSSRRFPKNGGICSVADCDKQAEFKTMCGRHYRFNKKYGDPLGGKIPINPLCVVRYCEFRGSKVLRCKRHFQELMQALKLMQNSCCAICSKHESEIPRRQLLMDHDWATGEPRGLLCNNCNTGIGHLREDPQIINSAINYLIKHGATE